MPWDPEQRSERNLVVVVVGGREYSTASNAASRTVVRELARRYPVLNVMSESHGSVVRRLNGRARHLSASDVARTAFGATRARRVEERLWLAPVRGLSAITPLSFPEPVRRRNVRRLTRLIRSWLDEVGARECLLIFYWWALPELVARVPHVVSIYDCLDNYAALPGSIVPVRTVGRLEGQLLDAVDRTYVVSEGLLSVLDGPGREIRVLPNGFDLKLFERVEAEGFTVPKALRSVPGPIIGYAGGLGSRMDWKLLTELALPGRARRNIAVRCRDDSGA